MSISNFKKKGSLSHLNKWAILLIILACSIVTKAQPDGIKIAQARVFGWTFTKNLYQAELTAMTHVISGMMLIKKTGDTYRAVFMSEIGLKYFDIEIGSTETGDYRVHYIMEMLNRKALNSFFETTLRMLTLNFGDVKKEYIFPCEEPGNTTQVIKTQHGKFSFDYQVNSGYISSMIHKRFLKKKLSIEASNYSHLAPATIKVEQKKIQFNLKQVEN